MTALKTLTHDQVRDYYARRLETRHDLKTNACCCDEGVPLHIREKLTRVEPEILEKFYGCGSPIPPAIEGRVVLDLGCGAGRDAYVLAQLVGPGGRVIGVDMTPEQLAVARRHLDAHMRKFGYAQPNIEFREGYIEDLRALDIPDASVDVVVSNCVINLSPDKRAVFAEALRVLKPGGELLFADIFSGRRAPAALADDPILRGECLGGALYIEDYRRMMFDLGVRDIRETSRAPIKLGDPDIEARVGMIDFYSITSRVFKLDLEDRCEDFGQTAVYNGGVPHAPHYFDLDDHHRFFTGKPMLVCGNTADMLSRTRFGDFFAVTGDKSRHYGVFDCSPAASRETPTAGGACC